MRAPHGRTLLAWLTAAGMLGAASVWLLRPSPEFLPIPAPAPAAAPVSAPAASVPATAGVVVPASGVLPAAPAGAPPEPGAAPAPYPVDLARLRAALPDNLYWRTQAPTKDPEERRARDAEARGWNDLFGKVQAAEASREEVQRYFEYRQRVSEDSIAFATRVLQDYGEQLPERDRGLLALSVNMHRSRLEDLPKEREEALARLEARESAKP